MLNSIRHLIKSRTYEILKQVQDDKTGLFTKPSRIKIPSFLSLQYSQRIHEPPEQPAQHAYVQLFPVEVIC
jgi:hypothetical protein